MTTPKQQADALKAEGNTLFQEKKFREAEEVFSQAIALDPTNHVLYSNRSGARASQEKYQLAKEDALETIKLNPAFGRGYSRLGAATFFLHEFQESVQAYRKAIEMDPNNDTLKADLARSEDRLNQAGRMENALSRMFNADLWPKIRAHPKLSQYANESDYVTMINSIIADPSQLSQLLGDQRIVETLTEMLQVQGAGPRAPPPSSASSSQQQSSHSTPPPPSSSAKATPPPPPKQPEPELTPEELEKKQKQQRAAEARERGKQAYYKKDFDTAYAEWNSALEIEWDAGVVNNLAALHFEKGEYEQCIKLCNEAIEKGRKNYTDFKIIARSFNRLGTAQRALGQLEAAIESFRTSLTEHRCADTLEKLNATEKQKADADAQAYINPEISVEERNKGNAFFKNHDFPSAVRAYTEAVKRNPADHLNYSNRAGAYTSLRNFQDALKDCEKCISLAPTFVKGYTRKAYVHYALKDYTKALEVYEQALGLDPENEEVKAGIETVIRAMNEIHSSDTVDEEQRRRALANPEIQKILQDPHMQMVMQSLQQDPRSAQGYLKDPLVMQNLQKLAAAGIVKLGTAPPPGKK